MNYANATLLLAARLAVDTLSAAHGAMRSYTQARFTSA